MSAKRIKRAALRPTIGLLTRDVLIDGRVYSSKGSMSKADYEALHLAHPSCFPRHSDLPVRAEVERFIYQ